jgi:cytochrome c553
MRNWALIVSLLLLAPMVRAADDISTGKKVYTSKCSRCHKFYDPTAYDDSKWATWMGKMRDKARLNDEQYRQLSAYLNSVRLKAAK